MASSIGTGSVLLNADVYFACLAHAFSTEREEIMGLLIGEVSEEMRALCCLCGYPQAS